VARLPWGEVQVIRVIAPFPNEPGRTYEVGWFVAR
jgi:hypothetical protein